MTPGRPSEIARVPQLRRGTDTPAGLARALERLQSATDAPAILEVVRSALVSCRGVGAGAIFVIDERGEMARHSWVRRPNSADPPLPEIELTGVARRAVREGAAVRQAGVTSAPVWACPMTSSDRIEGVVAVVGVPGGAETLLTHAGLALHRDRVCARDEHRTRRTVDEASGVERATAALDEILRDEDSGGVLRRITGAIARLSGMDGASLWTLRPEDGRYVETVVADGAAPRVTLPESAHGAEGFMEWSATFPRWAGHPWIPAGTIERVGPASGDTLVLLLPTHHGPHPLGFLLVEVAHPLGDTDSVKELHRWVALARLALESRVRRGRGRQDLETLHEEKEQIDELHRMKSQFIAAVSHELRTPLTSITAYAESLQSTASNAGLETRDRFLRVIHDESRRLSRIVDDILELATMDAGRVRMSCRPVDLRSIVRHAVDVIRPVATRRKIEFQTDPDDAGPAPVHADPDLMKQLTVSLLENAAKFSPLGGTVTVSLACEPATIRLTVEDQGPGIPSDKLDAVFERFYQLDGSNARQQGGSGLGLAICRSIATWHDARVWAESEAGKGARFVVSMPRGRATSRSRVVEPTVVDAVVEEHRVPELLTEMVAEVVHAETVSLMLLEPSGGDLFIQAALGLPDAAIRGARVALGERIAGRVAECGESLLVPDLATDSRFQETDRDGRYRTRSLLSAPVMLRGTVIGVINATNGTTKSVFDEYDRELLEILAERVALVLTKLGEVGDSPDDVHRIENAIRAVIDVRRHYYPTGDSYPDLVRGICEELGLDAQVAARIHYASILRDVGMIRLPEGTYKKPSALSEHDRELIRSHPEEGARILRSIEFLPDVFDIILAHHEEPDGSGYPRGLTDGMIPLGAKILAVADAFDALRSGRPYREAVTETEAIEELRRYAGKQFDPRVVEALAGVMRPAETATEYETRNAIVIGRSTE